MNSDSNQSNPSDAAKASGRSKPWYWIGPGIAFLTFGVWLLLDPTFLATAPASGENSWILDIPYALISVIGRTPTFVFMIVISLALLGWGARLRLRQRAQA